MRGKGKIGASVSRRGFLAATAVAPVFASRAVLGQTEKEPKTMVITVPEQKVPVLAECDVLVCGGGVSGITAAVSAARHGASVVLLERWPMLGGMATAALVTGWHRSDREKMVIYGLVEETAQRAEKHGWIWKDGQYPRAHETHWFEPEGMKIVYHDMLDEAKVRTFCYTAAGEPIIEGGRIRGVLADTKQGRRAVLAKIVVDATGDGDVAAKAGVPFEFGRASDGRVQGMTMMYRVCNIDEARVKSFPPDKARAVMEAMRAASKAGELPPFNHAFGLGHARNRFIPNMCPVSGSGV